MAKAVSGNSPSVQQLFAQLKRYGEEGEYNKAESIIKKILKESPQDKDALLCQLCCLIQQGKYDNALKFIKNNKETFSGVDLVFEESYCYYRLNKTTTALEILQSQKDLNDKCKELLAQVLYRLEKYKECMSLYKTLIKNAQDDYGNERETNLAAAAALLGVHDRNLREDTYELRYNAACNLLSRRCVKDAINKLQEAEDLCKQSYEDDPDVTEEEIEEELGVVKVQLGYANQLNHNNAEALRLYNNVLKAKPRDSTLVAIASNNVITINKDKDVFDSKKKVKAFSAEGLRSKLTTLQRRAMEMNKCLLHIYANQPDQFEDTMRRLIKTHGVNDRTNILSAFRFFKDKNNEGAIHILEEAITKSSNASQELYFTLAQLHLMQGSKEKAIDVLKKMKDHHRLGVVANLVALITNIDDAKGAITLLDAVTSRWRDEAKGSELPTQLFVVLKENANLKLRLGMMEDAVSLLVNLRRLMPNDIRILSQLITAYAKFYPEKAEQLSKELPDVECEIDINVDDLEMAQHLYSARQAKRMTKMGKDSNDNDLKPVIVRKKRRPRKRKGKIPKKYDADKTPDPERWLPRRERSYFKKKKRAPIGKGGSQGSAASSSTAFDTSPAVAAAQARSAPIQEAQNPPEKAAVAAPPTKKPAKKPAKKKKGKGW